jgi:hypothetical protein
VLLAIALVLGVVVLVVGFEFYRGGTARPTIATNYSTQIHDRTLERQRAAHGPGPNQHPAYQAAMDEVRQANAWLAQQSAAAPSDPDDPPNPWTFVSLDLIYTVPTEGTPEQFEAAQRQAEAALAEWERRGVFERSAEVAALTRLARPPSDDAMFEILLPNLGTARVLARAQAARARLASRAGDRQTLAIAIEQTLTLGRQVADLGLLIDWLVGVAVQALGRAMLLDNLLLHPVDDDAWLARLDAVVERELVERLPPLERVIDNERLYSADVVQRVFTDDGRGNGRFIPLRFAEMMGEDPAGASTPLTPFGATAFSNIHARLFLDRADAMDWINGSYDLLAEAGRARGEDAMAADQRVRDYYAAADWRNPMAMNVAHMTSTLSVERTNRVHAAGTRVVLAIERYRLRHGGAVPHTLGELGDLLPAELMNDPYTGQAWDYEPTPVAADVYGDPLPPGSHVWPYTLKSRAVPGHGDHTDRHRPGLDANCGVLITTPIEGPQYDEPPEAQDEEGDDAP